MMGHPGKKLSFMGNEFAQFIEWNYSQGLDWLLLDYPKHRQMQTYVKELNQFYLDHPALWQNDSDWEGFSWISHDDFEQNIIAFRRIDKKGKELIVICNFCPVCRKNYRIGVPYRGKYIPVLSSDEKQYGGIGTPLAEVRSEPIPMHGYDNSINITVPAMATVFYAVEKTPVRKSKGIMTEDFKKNRDKTKTENKKGCPKK